MQWGRQFRRVLRSTVVVIGGLVALLIVGTGLFANSLAPNPPDEQNFDLVESAPGAKALFGTDRFGRDVLSRVIYGSRISLYVAVVSIGIAMVVGGVLGLTGGYLGGTWDNVINRVMDVFFSIPGLLLAVGIAALGGLFLGIRSVFDPVSGPTQLIFAFEAVVIGGMGSLWGTLVGGIALGVAQTLGAQIHPQLAVMAGHLLFLAVLIVRFGGGRLLLRSMG